MTRKSRKMQVEILSTGYQPIINVIITSICEINNLSLIVITKLRLICVKLITSPNDVIVTSVATFLYVTCDNVVTISHLFDDTLLMSQNDVSMTWVSTS